MAFFVLTAISTLDTSRITQTFFAESSTIWGGHLIQKYSGEILNQFGRPVVNSTVAVFLTGTQSAASLYSADNINSPTTNPIIADNLGYFFFYTPDGVYDVVVSGPTIATTIRPGEQIFGQQAAGAVAGQVIIAYSSTPVFDATVNDSFIMTLTGNVTSSSIVGSQAGQIISFIIRQDSTGGRTFVWPGNVKGAMNIGIGGSEISAQTFVSDAASLYAITPGVVFA